MNRDDIEAFKNVISCFNISRCEPEYRPIRYDNSETMERTVSLGIYSSFRESKQVECPLAAYLFMFTAYDGYLENKRGLTEGESFKRHYEALPSGTDMERIQKYCYRVMKIIRNTIQHNMSAIEIANNELNISYMRMNTDFSLRITTKGLSCLNTIIYDCIVGNPYKTQGHYEEITKSLYKTLCKEIITISDDIGDSNWIQNISGIDYKNTVRYIVSNGVINDSSDYILMHYNEEDEQYRNDYIYICGEKAYMLPEEIGIIDKENKKITFKKECLKVTWEVIKK